MFEKTVYIRVPRAKAREALRRLPHELARGMSSIAQGFRNGIAFALLQKISENLVANSEHGGTPDVNLNWPPLAQSTIQQRLHKTEYRSRQTQKARERNLTDAQKKEIRKKINQAKNDMIEDGVEPGSALGLARAQVYNEYRLAGVKIPTSRELVPILRDTSVGANGLSPVQFNDDDGTYQAPRAGTNPDTGEPIEPIHENTPGAITVGVRGYMARHHEGGERLPQRRLWPDPNEWPDDWWEHVADVEGRLLVNAAIELAKGAA